MRVEGDKWWETVLRARPQRMEKGAECCAKEDGLMQWPAMEMRENPGNQGVIRLMLHRRQGPD